MTAIEDLAGLAVMFGISEGHRPRIMDVSFARATNAD